MVLSRTIEKQRRRRRRRRKKVLNINENVAFR
jgi:hypothetical protein